MYDLCDVLHASTGSADVISHVLCEYGDGSMGAGVRKLAGEMLIVGGQKSYGLGYNTGASNAYPTAFKNGVVTGSIIGVSAVALIGFGIWGTKKLINYQRSKKHDSQRIIHKKEVSVNA